MRHVTRARNVVLSATIGTLALAASSARARPVEVTDPRYHMNAITMSIPDGWKFAGTVARAGGCHAGPAGIKYTAQSPDGLTGFENLPGVQWNWASSVTKQQVMSSMGCPVVEIQSAADFLVAIAVPMLHRSAKVISVGPLLPAGKAAIAQQLEQARQQNAQMAARYGQPPQKLVLEGARIRIEFMKNGHVIEEILSAVINCTESQLPGLMTQPAYTDRTCASRSVVLTFAPKGQLDAFMSSPAFTNVQGTIRANPEWQNRVSQDQATDFRKNQADAAAAFQRTLASGKLAGEQRIKDNNQFLKEQKAKTDAAIAEDRKKMGEMDSNAHQTALFAGDRGDFIDPSNGRKIEASSQYNHQWLSSEGTHLVQTNDPTYDPNGRTNINESWTELVPSN
ncbi:MAG: hypothetical protein H0U66_13630 [Gemmatimonadaceae bacterium]|nr:hypothetical protein [Gemmatimonadaceae bacterium]